VTKTTTKAGKEMDMIVFESSDDDDEDKKKSISEQQRQHSDSFSNLNNDKEEQLLETIDLAGIMEKEKIPTSKAAFKQSPFYVIPSILNSQDVLHPDAKKHICGVFKGELVYRRSDVSKALKASKWLYQGRKVKDCEIGNPVKKVKTRKKPGTAAASSSSKKNFQALSSYGISEEAQVNMISTINDKNNVDVDGIGVVDDGMDNLYGKWQTVSWSPPYIGPNDIIPTNEYRNVELALINPGLSHLDQTGLAPIAKKLGIPYAPCMLGYEGSHVIVRGIVVHDHNVTLIREASVEMQSFTIEKEIQDKRNAVIHRWKRLVVGLLTKERLDREYG
jgi:xeroderma pigmentosum group C-complementing protein